MNFHGSAHFCELRFALQARSESDAEIDLWRKIVPGMSRARGTALQRR